MRPRHAVAIAVCFLAIHSASGQSAAPTNADASRVDAILSKMTLEEKIDYIGGTGFSTRPLPNLGVPAFGMSDGPLGVRSNLRFPSTVYAAGIGLAATWNPELAYRVGQGIGRDARARGIHFMLGPGVNIYRAPMNGRNFEYFGEDPFLAASIAVGYINGIQSERVSATVKHFIGNNSEFDRHNSDSVIDERTLREIYLPAFEAAVKQAHVGSIMDSYNLLNGTHLTQSQYANLQVASKDWGFDGVVMSDWVATYDGVAAANNGLDLEMPTGAFMNRKNLLPAVQDGRVTMATLDEKVRRILLLGARFGWLDNNQADLSLSKYSNANHQIALDAAREAIVLLKNDGNTLPLNRAMTKSILVVGPDAYPALPVAGGSGRAIPFYAVSVLQGLGQYLGPNTVVYYQPGVPRIDELALNTHFMTAASNGQPGVTLETFETSDLSGNATSTNIVQNINNRGFSREDIEPGNYDFSAFLAKKSASHRWTGYFNAGDSGQYEITALGERERSGYRVYLDDKAVLDDRMPIKASQDRAVVPLTAGMHKVVVEDFQTGAIGGRMRVVIVNQKYLVSDEAKAEAKTADAVVVVVGFNADNETEGADRTFALPVGQNQLVREISTLNKKTIVAVIAGGSVDAAPWLANVPAYLQLWYPGEQGGTALAEVLFGDVNPSGRLPISFEKQLADNPSIKSYYTEPGTHRIVYNDGIFVGHRGYEHDKTEPLFPFGYGLSYTAFAFSNLAIKDMSQNSSEPRFEVSFDVKNTGSRDGAEVAQVYISEGSPSVPRPIKELKGFSKVRLARGETSRVAVPLDLRSFAFYDVVRHQWRANQGSYKVQVGPSSQKMELEGTLTLKEAAFAN
jgi:beta-glucosidase